jgi:molybdate transport system substrate-binding protein
MAAHMTIITSMAARHILAEVAKNFETATGVGVHVLAEGGVTAARRVRDGGACDLVVLASDALARLETDGHIVAGSCRVFAASATAVAVQSGAARPSLCDVATVTALIAGARAIGVSTGPSGAAVRALLTQLGHDRKPATWIVEAPPGVPVAQLLARGAVDVAFQQLSELLAEPGIDIVCPVPVALLPTTAFAVGLSPRSAQATQAQAFIAGLVSPDAAAVISRHGMAPNA